MRPEQHNRFADENDMFSYIISAKSGDQVKIAFSKIAGQLAGLGNIRPDLENSSSVVVATIVDHQR